MEVRITLNEAPLCCRSPAAEFCSLFIIVSLRNSLQDYGTINPARAICKLDEPSSRPGPNFFANNLHVLTLLIVRAWLIISPVFASLIASAGLLCSAAADFRRLFNYSTSATVKCNYCRTLGEKSLSLELVGCRLYESAACL